MLCVDILFETLLHGLELKADTGAQSYKVTTGNYIATPFAMWYIVIVYLWSSFCCSHTIFIIEDDWFLESLSVSGVGDILSREENISAVSCGIACSTRVSCTAANYFPNNKTCTLLHVEDVLDDWVKDDDVTYICVDCEPGPQG